MLLEVFCGIVLAAGLVNEIFVWIRDFVFMYIFNLVGNQFREIRKNYSENFLFVNFVFAEAPSDLIRSATIQNLFKSISKPPMRSSIKRFHQIHQSFCRAHSRNNKKHSQEHKNTKVIVFHSFYFWLHNT